MHGISATRRLHRTPLQKQAPAQTRRTPAQPLKYDKQSVSGAPAWTVQTLDFTCLPPLCAAIHCDITSEAAVTHAFATVLASAGALHVLVNNAGIGSVGSVAETTLGELNSLYDVNVKGTFLCLRAAVKAMLHNGDRKHVAQGGGGSDGALPQPWLSAARGGGADSPATEAHSHPPSTPLMQRAVSAPTEGTTMVSSTSPEAIKPSPDAGTDTAAAQGKMRLSAAAAAAGTAGTPAWGTAPSQGAPAVHKTNPIYPPSPSLKGGVCINVSSITAQVGMSERFAYSVSSGAIAAMTRSVAADYAAHGIRCNTVLPGRVHTKFMDEYLAQVCPGEEAAQLARLGSYHPLGRMAEPKEVAALVLYLVSDEAAFVTGCEYNLDGGAAAIRQ